MRASCTPCPISGEFVDVTSTIVQMKSRMRILCGLGLLASWAMICGSGPGSIAAEEAERFWSFQPVSAVAPPTVRDRDWAKSPVDQFILAKLEARGLPPAPRADRRTLLRRATFDLLGLPPTPEETAEFLADDSPDAFARVVDRLLASPHYGERWGRHWLDVVRYADARDLIQLPAESDFREAWRYRDWVVAAFNRDLSYDQLHRAADRRRPAATGRSRADRRRCPGGHRHAGDRRFRAGRRRQGADDRRLRERSDRRRGTGLSGTDAGLCPLSRSQVRSDFHRRLLFVGGDLLQHTADSRTCERKYSSRPCAAFISGQEIAALEAEQARDKARIVELSRDVNALGEREYRAWLERRVATETQRYLLARMGTHTSAGAGESPEALAEMAKERGLDAAPLARWIEYFQERHPHPALTAADRARGTEAAAVSQLAGEPCGKVVGRSHTRSYPG